MEATLDRRRVVALLGLSSAHALASYACGSSGPTAPTVPSADFAAQFDRLWTT